MSEFDWKQELMVHDWPESGPGSLTLEKLYAAFKQRLEAEKESLTQEAAEASALRQDAQRYRWLRAQHWTRCLIAVADTAGMQVGTQTYTAERLDERIDRLMKG